MREHEHAGLARRRDARGRARPAPPRRSPGRRSARAAASSGEALADAPRPPAARACRAAGSRSRRASTTLWIDAGHGVVVGRRCAAAASRNSGLPCARSTQRCARSGDVAKWIRASAERVDRRKRRQVEPCRARLAGQCASSSGSPSRRVVNTSTTGWCAAQAAIAVRQSSTQRDAQCTSSTSSTHGARARRALDDRRERLGACPAGARRCPSPRRRRPARCGTASRSARYGSSRLVGASLRDRARQRVATHCGVGVRRNVEQARQQRVDRVLALSGAEVEHGRRMAERSPRRARRP